MINFRVKLLNEDTKPPQKATVGAGAYDIFMPAKGQALPERVTSVHLGFAAAVPENYVALLIPRSSAGSRGAVLANTVGVIDSDYRGEWIAKFRPQEVMQWEKDTAVLQILIVPAANFDVELVEELEETARKGGFGSTGNTL